MCVYIYLTYGDENKLFLNAPSQRQIAEASNIVSLCFAMLLCRIQKRHLLGSESYSSVLWDEWIKWKINSQTERHMPKSRDARWCSKEHVRIFVEIQHIIKQFFVVVGGTNESMSDFMCWNIARNSLSSPSSQNVQLKWVFSIVRTRGRRGKNTISQLSQKGA